MESHLRIKFTASLTALQDLEPYSYKVLMYLATRADHFGICYPAPKTIAEHIGISVDCVYDKLQELFTWGYARLLRNAFYDRLTKKSSPAVFQVSPHFMEIAEQFFEEALSHWNTGFQNRFKTESNQQQEPTSKTTAFNQPQETTTTTNNPSKETDLTAKSEPQKQQREQQDSPQDDNRKNPAIVKNYTNPILIDHELEDLQEHLAQKIVTLGIKIIMARGFVTEYGYSMCNAAYDYFEVCSKRQEITNPAGWWRSVLQSNLVNTLPSMQPKNYSGRNSEYDDFIES